MIVALATALAQEAVFEDLPIDPERFKPPSDTYGYVLTESSTTLGHLQVGVGLWGNYSEDQLVLIRQGARVLGPPPDAPDGMLDKRGMVDLQGGFGLGNVFSLSVSLPIVLWQEGFEPTPYGTAPAFAELLPSGLGDVRVTPKFVLLDIGDRNPLGIAVLGTVTAPTASRRSFMGEGNLTASPMLVLELADASVRDHDHHVRFAVNAGARLKDPDRFRGLDFGTEFVYRAGLAVRPTPALEMGADLAGAVAGPQVPQAPLELAPFVRLLPVDTASLVMGAGFGMVEGAGAPDLRLFAGATLAPKFDPLSLDRDKDGIANKYDACVSIPEDQDGYDDADGCPEDDNDGDGLKDPVDRCPNEPEDFDGFQDDDGCPDLDNDADGILDAYDRCVFQPEDFDGFQDLDGCPEPDNDLDGFPDPSDACPNAAETRNGFEDTDGCPDEMPHIDTDGDGFPDDRDACPLDPEDFDGWQDEDGCPDPDNDLDGLLDPVDDCPFEPETVNGFQDQDGCPDTPPSRVILQQAKIEILDRVYFEVDRAVIDPVSYSLLDEVAAVIQDNPAISRIRVEGHTDADGSETYNTRLSQSRADAVVAYLVERGIAPERLDPVGFGESRPIDSNKTSEGKQNNRRVEFVIVAAQ